MDSLWGGKMKKVPKDKLTVAIVAMVDPIVFKRVDRLAAKADMTRSKLAANMIEVATDYLETMESVGVFAVARVFQELREKINEPGKVRKFVDA